MKNIKRVISIFLVLSLLFSVSAMAAVFTDLEGAWSKDYIMDLYERGYMNGYEDNTMRPENEITGAEALVMLSRIFKTDDLTLELAITDYGAYANNIIPSGLSWLNNENAVVICLAGGVITKPELEALINSGGLTGPIEKEYLSVLFIRAMQLENTAKSLSDVSLGFYDTADITADYVPYIYLLTEAGIITGTDENTFLPHGSVTRAVVATMLSRTLSFLEDGEGLPTLEDYSGIGKIGGVIKSASASTIVISTVKGIVYEFSLASGASVTIDGTAKSLSSAYVGNWVTVYYDKITGKATAAAVDTTDTWVQGNLTSRTTTSARKVTLEASGTDTSYNVNTNALAYYEDKSIDYTALAGGNFVTAILEGGSLTAIYAYNGTYDLAGTITGISYGSTTTLSVYAGGGLTFRLPLNVSSPPKITRGKTEYSNGINKLQEGNNIAVTIVKNVITLIDIEEQEASVTGTVSSINYTAVGTIITIKDAFGIETAYTAASSLTVIKGGVEVTLSDLKIGDTVSMVVYDLVVSDITIILSASSAGTLTGTVAYIGSSKEITVISDSNTIITVTIPAGAVITGTVSGTINGAKNIPLNATVTIYGSYTSSTEFTATLIVVIE